MAPRSLLGLVLAAALVSPTASAGLAQRTEVQEFIDEMVRDHAFERRDLEVLFQEAKEREDILTAISRPAEAKPWRDYRPLFVTQDRIKGGVEFWRNNAASLEAAEREFGVPAHIIVAIVGVETRYGKFTGRYRVLDALSTLAFGYPPRSPFFRGQLTEYLLMAREEGVDARELLGSYAGAMGQPQFMPSSFRNFAVDFDGDGRRDLWKNPADVIGSVANYFHMHGWRYGAPVVHLAGTGGDGYDDAVAQGLEPVIPMSELATLGIAAPDVPALEKVAMLRLEAANGPEYYVARHNFYVITRYNRSPHYAMAVYELGEAIRAARITAGVQ